MVKILTHIIPFLFILSITLTAQSNEQIEEKGRKLSEIKTEIKNLETKLDNAKKEKDESLQTLEKINYQSLLLNKIIINLLQDEKVIDGKIKVISSEISTLENDMEDLKKDYARYIKWLYMNGKESQIQLLLSSKSFNQAVMRFKYYNYITDKNEERLIKLETHKNELEILQSSLKSEDIKKGKIVSEKRSEMNRLSTRKNEKEKLIENLKNDEKNIESEIEEKRQFEIVIKDIIAELIEVERERQRKLHEEKLRSETGTAPPPLYNYANFENFAELKGKLTWPVSSGKIIRAFGENTNEKLKTITLNYGIDIESTNEAEVNAVAQGVVSAIDWIPGYGSIIILTHKNDYRTVYGHVIDIQVNVGEIVKAGTLLGKVNQSLEGDIIHFEIWNERNYQNPETWLVEK